MAQSNGEATLDVYIYDHLVRKKLHNTANSLMTEGRVSPDPVAIDTPGGLLFAWWSMFRDIYNAKTKEKQAVEYELNVYIYDYLVKKELHNTAMTFMCEVKVSPVHVAVDTPGGFLLAWWSVFWAFFNAEPQQGKEKEQMKQPNPWNTETFQPHMDAGRIHHGQMVHGQQGGVLSALQQLQSRTQQTPENKSEVNLWASPRQLPVDPSTVYGQGLLQSKPGMGNTGLNPGVGAHSLRGWPFTGIDNMRQGLGPQVQKAFLQNQGQFELSPQQQQQQEIMAQVQGQGNMTSSLMYGDMDPLIFTGFPRGNLNSKDGQQNANNDGSMLSNSSKLINMPPVQQSSPQQQDPLLSQQNNGTMLHVNNMPKGPMMYGYDEIGGLPSSANQLDDIEPFGDVGALEDALEPFLFADVASVYNIPNWNPSNEYIEPQPNPMNTETFQPHMDPRMALPESGTTYHGEMVQGNHQGGDVSDSVLETREDDASKTPASARHIRRCNCKKSNCRKGYCACFQFFLFFFFGIYFPWILSMRVIIFI